MQEGDFEYPIMKEEKKRDNFCKRLIRYIIEVKRSKRYLQNPNGFKERS